MALADAWAAPILTTESGTGLSGRSIETVVLTRERGAPSLYESVSSAVRRMVLGERGLDKKTTQYLDAQSRLELQGELRRLEQERRANTDSPRIGGDGSRSVKGKESVLRGNPSLVRTTPSRGCLANKAFQLMALAAILFFVQALHRCYLSFRDIATSSQLVAEPNWLNGASSGLALPALSSVYFTPRIEDDPYSALEVTDLNPGVSGPSSSNNTLSLGDEVSPVMDGLPAVDTHRGDLEEVLEVFTVSFLQTEGDFKWGAYS